MLDAFIIDRMRREREAAEDKRPHLYIEVPMPDLNEERRRRYEEANRKDERGCEIINFNL